MTATVLRARWWAPERFRRWLAIARLAEAAGKPVIALAAATNLMIGLLPAGFIIGTSAMLQRVASLAAPHRSAGGWSILSAAFALAVGSLVLQNALAPMQAAVSELVTRRVDGRCAGRLMAVGLDEAPMEMLESREALDALGDVRSGLVERTVTPGSAAAGLLCLLSRYTQLAVAVLLVGVVLGPWAGLVIGTTAVATRFGNRGSLSRWSAVIGQLSAQRRRLRYVMDSGSSRAIAKEMRLLGILPWYGARAAREATALFTPLWRERRRIYYAPFLLLSALALGGATFTLIILCNAAASGAVAISSISLAIQAILITMRFGVFFPESDVQTQYGMMAYDTLREFEQRCAADPAEVASAAIVPVGAPRTAITFEDVRFAYPGSDRAILSGLSLRIDAGRSTAIVGLNGAGKTTLVKLLARLYEPTGGRITVDGADLARLNPQAWQRRLAAIFQDFVRYELDAAANIGLGACEHLENLTALRSAAASAGAAGIVGSLPAGLATPLSARYLGGVDLSGGQWQRIALARALFAVGAGASVLILDEPTAQLDVRAEVAFFDRFLELTRGLTSVIISHRFSTVRRADTIAVLADGRIAEQGSHDELVGRGGEYARLFRLQASRFLAEPGAWPEPGGSAPESGPVQPGDGW